MSAADAIASEVRLIEDLLDLNVISIRFSRLSALLNEDDVSLSCSASVLDMRSELLTKLLEKLPATETFDNLSSLYADYGSEEKQSSTRPYVPQYLKDDECFESKESEGTADAEAKTEEKTHDAVDAAEVTISKFVFNELCPTQEPSQKIHLPGSFPDIDDFSGEMSFVGSGYSGLVFKTILHGVPVVLKVSKKKSESANRGDYREWSVCERLEAHPNVLQVIGLCPSFQHRTYWGVGTTAIISPWMANEGLRSFYDKRSPSKDDLHNIAFGMINGIRSLHKQGAVHRDIAVRNFLVDNDGRVLLCDFGLTEFIPDGENWLQISESRGEELPWRYLAPESVGGIFSRKSDIWMFGLALIELVTNKEPWSNFHRPEDLRRALKSRQIDIPTMDGIPSIISEIAHDCLNFEPFDRPSADEIAEKLVRWQFATYDQDRDANGNTALHRMLLKEDETDVSRYLSVRNLLMSKELLMINAVNNFDETPLMLAKTEKLQKLILSYRKVPLANAEPSKLMEYFHNIDVFGTLRKLAKKEDIEMIRSLGKLDMNSYATDLYRQSGSRGGDTALHIAAKLGNADLMDALLSLNLFNESALNEFGQTALHVATLGGNAQLIEKLLYTQEVAEAKGDAKNAQRLRSTNFVNIQDRQRKTALHLAAKIGDVSVLKTLMSYSATKLNLRDENGESPIFAAIHSQNENKGIHLDALQAFVRHPGVEIYVRNSRGDSILHEVVRRDLAEAAEVLLQGSGIDGFEQGNTRKGTFLHLAVQECSSGVVSILVSREDVSVQYKDQYENNLLHILAAMSSANSKKSQKMSIIADELISRIDIHEKNSFGRNPLQVASTANNLTVGMALLSRPDIDVNARDRYQRTPLHHVALKNAVEFAGVLLSSRDVQVNAQDTYGKTPLHLASLKNNVEVAELLISANNVDAATRDNWGSTPFLNAVQRNNVEVVKMFLSKGVVNFAARDYGVSTALHIAAQNNSVQVAELLILRQEVEPNARGANGLRPLHTLARLNKVAIARILLSRDDVDVNAPDESDRTPLHEAAHWSSVEVAELLLSQANVDVNAPDKHQGTPLHSAVGSNSIEIVELLLSRDDINADFRGAMERTPLHEAALKSSILSAKALLERDDVDLNAQDRNQQTPLHYAILAGSDYFTKILLSTDGIDVNAHDNHQRSPLHYCAYLNAVDVLTVLLARQGVEINARDAYQRTLLHYAARENNVQIVKLLLSRDDVNVNATDAHQRTPLHYAAWKGNPDVVEALLSKDLVHADPQDSRLQTPLQYAARFNDFRSVRLLLARDDVGDESCAINGKTALDCAEKHGATECVELLDW